MNNCYNDDDGGGGGDDDDDDKNDVRSVQIFSASLKKKIVLKKASSLHFSKGVRHWVLSKN